MKVILAKALRTRAHLANVDAHIAGVTAAFSDDDLAALHMDIDVAALEARLAGVAIDDLVGPRFANRTF